tara:strand:+ start:78 stop:395 length:318 start_codon:yes stop_codon:yes gene_type:complete
MIKLYRLTTGEDLIGKQLKDSDVEGENTNHIDYHYIEKPFVLIPMRQGTNQASIGFTPYIPYSQDKQIKIKDANVICITNPDSKLEDAYKENTSTIKSAKPNLIV